MNDKAKAQLKQDKIDAYYNVLHKLSRAYCFDGDTDFITVATEVSKKYKETIRIYNFLARNRFEISEEARKEGDRMLHQLEIGD